MSNNQDTTSKLDQNTDSLSERVFGHVLSWTVFTDVCKITLSDKTVWVIRGNKKISRYSHLLDFSMQSKEPILLIVNNQTKEISDIFPTIKGVPKLYRKSPNGKELWFTIKSSPRIFKLYKDRPWFERVKNLITHSNEVTNPQNERDLWIGYDSVTGEVIDVWRGKN